MKRLLLATAVALLCIQLLNASPTKISNSHESNGSNECNGSNESGGLEGNASVERKKTDGSGENITKTRPERNDGADGRERSKKPSENTSVKKGHSEVTPYSTSSNSQSGNDDCKDDTKSSVTTTYKSNNGGTKSTTQSTTSETHSADGDSENKNDTKTATQSKSYWTHGGSGGKSGEVVTKESSTSSKSHNESKTTSKKQSNSSNGSNKDNSSNGSSEESECESDGSGTVKTTHSSTTETHSGDGKKEVITKTSSSSSSENDDCDSKGNAYGKSKKNCEEYINKLTAQVEELTKKLQQKDIDYNSLNENCKSLKSENALLQSKLNTANAETQSWKTQFESLTINFKQTSDDKIKCDGNLKESQSLVVVLQTKVVDIQNINIKLTSDSAQCKLDIKSAQKESQTCTSNNADLNNRIKDVTDKLTRTQKESQDCALQNISLKSTSDDMKKGLSDCQEEKKKLNESLKIKMADLNEDEKKLAEKMVLLKSTQVSLEQCTKRTTEIEASYTAEKAKVLDLTKKIAVIRTDYEVQIKTSLDSLNQCKVSLQSECDARASITIEVKNLKIHITKIQTKLEISIKDVTVAISKTKQCQDDSTILKTTIESLKSTNRDTSNELTLCMADKSKYENNVKESQTTITKLQQNIVDIQNFNIRLDSDATQCKLSLEASQKDVTSYKASNNDLTIRFKEVTEKLTCCENGSHTYALQVIALQSDSNNMKNDLSNCRADNNKLTESLNIKIADYTKDQQKLQQEIAELRSTKDSLDRCTKRITEVESSYSKERDNVLDLTNRIATIRADCDESNKKNEAQIKSSLENWNQCKISLESETNTRVSIENEVKTMRVKIIDIEDKLDISIKTLDKANSKTKQCEDENHGLKKTVDELKCTITDRNNDIQKCKTEKSTCEINVKNSQTTIITLQQQMVNIQNINIELTSETTQCKNGLEGSRKEVAVCTASNSDLVTRIKEITEKLTCAQKESQDYSVQIINLRSVSDGLKGDLSTCQGEKNKLNESLSIQLADYKDDEFKLQQEIAELKDTKASLDRCNRRYTQIEESYDSEKAYNIDLTQKIALNQAMYDESCKKYDEQVENLLKTFSQCKISLDSETNRRISVEIENTSINIQITEIRNQLNISLKETEKANTKTKQCEDESRVTIEQLKCTLTDTNTALTNCAQHSTSLQYDLTDRDSKLDKCNTHLQSSQSTIRTQEETIKDIQNININLNADKTQCKLDLDVSQKETASCKVNYDELNINIRDTNDKLTCCRNESHHQSVQIINLKNDADGLKKSLGICEVEKNQLLQTLEIKSADLTEEQRQLQAEISQSKNIQSYLDQCNTHNSEIETSYESEKANVLDLTNKIAGVLAEYEQSCKKYEEHIDTLLGNLNEYKVSLEFVRGEKASIEITKNNLNVQITEIQKRLDFSLVVIDEANSKTQHCEDSSNGLKLQIEKLKSSITDTTTDLTKITAEKIKCDINLKDSQSKVETLQQNIVDTLNASNRCKADLDASLEESSSCQVANNELTNKNNDLSERLKCSKNESQECSQQVITLKGDSDNLRKILDTCQIDNANLNEALKIKSADLTADQQKLQDEIALQKATQIHLDLCNARSQQIEESYKSEKTIVLDLTNKIAANLAQYDESCKKYDEQITLSNENYNQCKVSLKSVTDEKTSVDIKLQNLTIQMTETKIKLDKSLKAVDEANSRTTKCEENSNGLQDKIKGLECDLSDKSDDLKKCTKQSASLENDLKDSTSKLDTCNNDLKKSQSSINTLQDTVTNIKTINNKCNADVTQYRADLDNSNNEVTLCRTSNSQLTSNIKDVSDKLTCCQKDSHEAAIQFINLKSSSDELKKNLSTCQIEILHVTELFELEHDGYDIDERKLQEDIERSKATKASLEKCYQRNTEIEEDLKEGQATILVLTNKIASINTECDDSRKTYQAQIDSSSESLNQCKGSLNAVTNEKISIENVSKNLNIHITEINKTLDISRKTVDEVNEKIKKCEVDSSGLKDKIKELGSTVSDTSYKLTKCAEHSASIQNDLNNIESKVTQCNTNLEKATSTICTLQETITDIQNTNNKLRSDNGQCLVDLDASRKETNVYTIQISDLIIKINDVSERLSSCKNEANNWSLQVISLKNDADDVKKHLGDCEINKALVTEALTLKIDGLTEEERQLQVQIAQLKTIKVNLDVCTERNKDLETSYASEKANVLDLTKKMEDDRAKCEESRKIYEGQIESLLANLNQSKVSLELVKEEKASIEIKEKNLNIHITEIQKTLDITLKVVDEANSNIKTCEDTSSGLRVLIDQLQDTITDRTTEVTHCNAENTKCGINLKESRSSVDTLKETVANIQNTNNKLSADGAQCKLDLDASKEGANTCRKTKDDLTIQLTDANDKLTCCRNEGHQQSVQIIKLKNDNGDLKNNLGACEANITNLMVSLNMKIADLTKEEQERQKEIVQLKSIQVNLDLCTALNIAIQSGYDAEKANVADLTNKIAGVHTQCEESRIKYEEKINVLIENLNEYKDSVKYLGDQKLAIEIDLQNSKIEITEVRQKLEITLKDVDEANSNTKRCQDSSNDLKHVNDKLESDIKQKSTDLTQCIHQSASLQNDLKDCGSKSDKCNINLQSSQSTVESLQDVIENIEKENKKLTKDSSQCKLDLSASLEESSSCRATNNDLTINIKDISERLGRFKTESYEYSVQVNNLKTASDDLKIILSTCEGDKAQLNKSLELKIADYNEDERKLQDEIARLLSTQSYLDLCTLRNAEVEAQYIAEKANTVDLNKKLEKSRLECEESSNRCNEQIHSLQCGLNECKVTLNSETTEVNNLKVQVSEIQNKLNISTKAVEVANYNIKECDNDKLVLKTDLSRLRCNVNSYLQGLKDTEAKALQILNDGANSLIQSNDIYCRL